MHRVLLLLCAVFMILASGGAWASSGEITQLDFTATWMGIVSIIVFVFAYTLVVGEEFLHLRKSKPVMVAAGIIWILVAISYKSVGDTHSAHDMIQHNILEYAELLLFLLAAMTYVNTMQERNVFGALRALLVSRGYSLNTIFWITGLLAFCISPIADNLTTALVMAAVVMAVGGDNKTFIGMGCVNIVIAANAGGAFSPFGDITTLMVWQKGLIEFSGFFALLVPAIVNWIVPAVIMSFFLPKGQPPKNTGKAIDPDIKRGGIVVIFLFLGTISLAVIFHSLLHLPSMVGMMTGLGVLKLYAYYLKITSANASLAGEGFEKATGVSEIMPQAHFDVFDQLQRAEWDTLMFFYGVVLCVGGLGAFGYLNFASVFMYQEMGASWANILVGIMSAIIDNIPVMFAVLTMMPEMEVNQWLLVTLTAGVGGSLLSIGSAAGVALMGQARGMYTFFGHLKWSWAIALGYIASIYTHFLISGMQF
jgi:Na+/H+ antiporter NhaD/arsenite permease-like protein